MLKYGIMPSFLQLSLIENYLVWRPSCQIVYILLKQIDERQQETHSNKITVRLKKCCVII